MRTAGFFLIKHLNQLVLTTPNLLVVTHYHPGTGFTRVMEHVLPFLSDHFQIHYLGVGYSGERKVMPHWTLHPTNPLGDVYGSYRCAELATELEAAAILFLDDFWMFRNHKKALLPFKGKIPMLAYLPLDGDLTNASMLEYLDFLDDVILYHPGAQEHLEALGAGLDLPRTSVIPHGTALSNFTPLSDKRAVKAALFGPEHMDDFIVLNANRPVPRKRIDLTLEAFARFAEGKPVSVKLYLHHWQLDESEEEAMRAQIEALGINERVLLSTLTQGQQHLSDSELNRLYNACDVGINTAMGEGWGMVSFEHAATGAPQLVPNHSACAALWQESGILIPVSKRYVPEFSPLEMGEVNVQAAADGLEQLYSKPALYEHYANASLEQVDHPLCDWENIGKQWLAVLQEQTSLSSDSTA